MSIDIGIDSVRALALTSLLPKIASVLAELLGVPAVPPLTVSALEDGNQVSSDAFGSDDAPVLHVSVDGEPETVAIVSTAEHGAVSMSGH